MEVYITCDDIFVKNIKKEIVFFYKILKKERKVGSYNRSSISLFLYQNGYSYVVFRSIAIVHLSVKGGSAGIFLFFERYWSTRSNRWKCCP